METYPELSNVHTRAARVPAGQFDRYVLATFCIALVLAVILFILKAGRGLTSWEYGDETAYFVTAQMITQGHHLYRDVFTHHGPLPVMIAHLYAVIVDRHDFSHLRISQILMASLSCAAVLLSPVLKTWSARICAAAAYMALLSMVWLPKFLNMELYPSIGGYFSAIMLAQCIVPLIFQRKVNSWSLFVGGTAFALAGFAAYPYFFSGMFFILSSIAVEPAEYLVRCPPIKTMLIGATAVITGVLLWLLIFGDIAGYFIYHIYFNQMIYSKFIEYSPISVLNNLSFSLTQQHAVQNVTIVLMVGWVLIFSKVGALPSRRAACMRITAIGLIVCGVLFTNPTGDLIDHNNAFLIPNFALFSLAIALLMQRSVARPSIWGSTAALASAIAAAAAMGWAANLADTVFGAENSAARLKPEDSEIYRFIRSITREDGDLLSLIDNPIVYVRAARFPASGNIYYLPWQATYNRSAFGGYKIDICSDIRRRRPTVIWFFNWRVWDKESIETYEPCVLAYLVKDYAPIGFDSPWHVRKDILALHSAEPPRDEDSESLIKSTLEESKTVGNNGPIQLMMTPEHERRAMQLRRLGVLFASGPAQGDAELVLRGPRDSIFTTRFSLSSIAPNKYHYFELSPGLYKSGEIHSISGGNVRLWEGHVERRGTCLIYEYVDSSRAHTPACPVLDPLD